MYTCPFTTSSVPSFLKGIDPSTVLALHQSASHLCLVSRQGVQEVAVSLYALKAPTGPSVTAELRGSASIAADCCYAGVWGSPGGNYAIVSLYDERQLLAENYTVALMPKKQQLCVAKLRGVDSPITALTFMNSHHPIWNSISPPAEVESEAGAGAAATQSIGTDEVMGAHSTEFIFATADNTLNIGQIVKTKANISKKSKVVSLSKGPILKLHVVPINHNTIDAAKKFGIQRFDEFSTPTVDLSAALKDIDAYKYINLFLTFVCARGMVKIYLHTAYSLFDLVFTSAAELTRFNLSDAEVLQCGQIVNTVADLFYFATSLGLVYQVVAQSTESPHIFLRQYTISPRVILESVLRSRACSLLKSDPLSQSAQESDASDYSQLRSMLKKCTASSFMKFVVDITYVRGLKSREPVLIGNDTDAGAGAATDATEYPGALLGMAAFNYHTVIVTAMSLLVFNCLSGSQVACLQNPASYNELCSNVKGMPANQLPRLQAILQRPFIYSGAELKQTFPTVTDKGTIDISTVVHFYLLMLYGPQLPAKTKPQSLAPFKIDVADEAASMWFVYYTLHDYERALAHCPSEDMRRLIKEEYAKHCIATGKILYGAQLFAHTNLPLLTVYKDLINTKKYEVAAIYLQEKLAKMPAHNPALIKQTNVIQVADFDSITAGGSSHGPSGYIGLTKDQANQTNYQTARKLVVHMIVEAMILEVSTREADVATYRYLSDTNVNNAYLSLLQAEDHRDVYKKKLLAFLCTPEYKSMLDYSVLQSSLLDHGLNDIFLQFSKQMQDVKTLLTAHILVGDYKNALQILADQELDLFYFYSEMCLANIPKEFLAVVRKKTKHAAAILSGAEKPRNNASKEHIFTLSKLTKEFVEALSKDNADTIKELVSFFRWLLIDEEGSVEPAVNTFALEFLAKAGESELFDAVIDSLPADFSIDTSAQKFSFPDIIGLCRRYGFKDSEAKCLVKLGNQIDALSLSLSLHKKIELEKIDFGEMSERIVCLIKKGDTKGDTLAWVFSAQDEPASDKKHEPTLVTRFSLSNEHESLLLDTLDLIERSTRVEQKRQLLRTLINWIVSAEVSDSTDSLTKRGWSDINLSLSKADVYGIVNMAFKYLMCLRAVDLSTDFSFVSLSEIMDMLLATNAEMSVLADSLYITLYRYQDRCIDTRNNLDKCVNQIVAKKAEQKEVRNRTVEHNGPAICGVCSEYLSGVTCLAASLGIYTLAKGRYNYLKANHTAFFCGHMYHTCCLAFHMASKSSRIGRLVKECEAALQSDITRPTGLIDKLIGKLANSCPLCDANGVEELNIDICSGKPTLLALPCK